MSSIRRSHSTSKSESKLDPHNLADRESSFSTTNIKWPSSLPSPDLMAEAGFYFSPNEKSSDCTTCFKCGVKIYNWLPDDTPKIEHKKFSPSCKEVKSWTDVPVEDDRRSINRAEQTDSVGFRSRLADKAKKLTGALHRRTPSLRQNEPSANGDRSTSEAPSTDRFRNDDERLADVQRRREVAEKALDGLQKLSSFYPSGSSEQNRAEQSIILQTADLERLRDEENQLLSRMDTLSFGRGWHVPVASPPLPGQRARAATTSDIPYRPEADADDSELSPEFQRGRANRPLPMLPSQLNKDSLPRMPTRVQRSNTAVERPAFWDGDDHQIVKSSSDVSSSSFKAESETEIAPVTEVVQQDEWTEYFTPEGVPYYYNIHSKETVWTIPGRDGAAINSIPSINSIASV